MFYTNNFVTHIPADLNSLGANELKKNLILFPEEAVYVYSFKHFKMIYAAGWEGVLGIKDSEITLKRIFELTTEKFHPFSSELNEKAMQFILNESENLHEYSFMIELEKYNSNGGKIPMIVRVGVLNEENGKVKEVIGRFQVNRSLRFGNVMKYAAFGPLKSNFELTLNKKLFKHYAISQKELEAIDLASKGYTIKEIANRFQVSHSAIEKRIIPLYNKFQVKSLTQLVTFCYENQLLPI